MNMSILHGGFRDEMKVEKVIPLFKAGDVMIVSNYRPVSVLPVLSQVFERVLRSRLVALLDANGHSWTVEVQGGPFHGHGCLGHG